LRFTHDAVGNLLTAEDFISQYAFTYDELDRQLASDNLGTPGLPHVVLTNAYDAVGNRLSVQDNAGVTVSSTYDIRNLLESRTWSGGGIDSARVDFAYNANGDRTSIERFADLAGLSLVGRTVLGYDDKRRLTDITHRNSADSILADYDYIRDLADQLISETHHGQTSTYAHDSAGQLLSATHSGQPNEGYAYEANGNRQAAGVNIGLNNQILSDGTYNYTYDAEGNLTRKTEIGTGQYTEFFYDHRNRLVRGTVKSAGGIILREVLYTYDVFDRNIARTVDSDGAGPAQSETRYTIYDGSDTWADYDSSGTVLTRYLFGDRIDEIMARWRPSEGTSWYLTDHLGTVRDIVNATGILIDTITYDSFGNILSQTSPSAGDRFTFTSREWDSDHGLYYYRARFYAPRLGRFISQDPLGFAAGDVNLYRYVGNRPLTSTDPSGHLAITECAFVKGLGATLQFGCGVAEIWARDPERFNLSDPDIQAEIAMQGIMAAASVLPFGASLAVQLTMQAVVKTQTPVGGQVANEPVRTGVHGDIHDAVTALEPLAPFLGPFAGVGFQVYGVDVAYMLAKREPDKYSKLFWVRAVCAVADLGLMVWSARDRCFIAGTPVVIGFLPIDARESSSEESTGLTVFDGLGGLVLIAGIVVVSIRRRRDDEEPESGDHEPPNRDELNEDEPQEPEPMLPKLNGVS
jgi:RHS repeat-associated protein